MASIFHISEILKNLYFILHDVFIACGRDTADNAVVGELHGDLSLTARMLIDGGVDDAPLHGAPDGGDDVEGDDGDVVRSGQMTREQCATPNWDEAKAQERMDNILTTYYTGAKLDAVLCSNDSVSLGIQSALKSAGYNTADRPMPVITGQDANLPNVKAIVAGEQSMSVFKDTRALADQVVKMVDAILAKQQPEVNNTKDYNNGVKVVPSYLLEPKFVDKSNYKQLLIDSGYYTEAELQK